MVPRHNKNCSNALVNSKPSNSSNSSKNVNSDSTCCNKTSIYSKNCRNSGTLAATTVAASSASCKGEFSG